MHQGMMELRPEMETGAEAGLESKTRRDLIPDQYSHQQLCELTGFFLSDLISFRSVFSTTTTLPKLEKVFNQPLKDAKNSSHLPVVRCNPLSFIE